MLGYMLRGYKLIISLALPQLAGVIGSLFTYTAVTSWYATLTKPEFAPPNWVFAPVWTTLFVLMGMSAFLIWEKGSSRADVRFALFLFLSQLLLNTLWSVIFFGSRSFGWALIELILLWLALAATIIAFARISKIAGLLLVPYLGWVTFAGILNFAIWSLN